MQLCKILGKHHWLLHTLLVLQKATASGTNRIFHWFPSKLLPMSVTTELLHGQLPMQVYAPEQQCVTTELLHSWVANMNTNNIQAKILTDHAVQ